MPLVHAFDYLERPAEPLPYGICTLFGDDRYLTWMVRQALERIYDAGDGGLGMKRWSPATPWAEVMGDLSALSLFGPPTRVGLIESADSWVSANRKQLEAFQATRPEATLVLEVTSWPATTKLYVAVNKDSLAIACSLPASSRGSKKVMDTRKLSDWLCKRASQQHGISLTPSAARYMIDHAPPELGILDQGLAKLALFVQQGQKVSPDQVAEVAVGWRARTAFDVADAAMDGNAPEALLQLDRLVQAGEEPLAMLAGIAWSLRRYGLAAQYAEHGDAAGRGVAVGEAVRKAGFRHWEQDKAEQRLRRRGRQRALALPVRLLEIDLALKGSHSASDRGRLALEQLLVWLAAKA